MGAANPEAQTAFGPMVLSAIEHHEPPQRRLVDDDLAAAFLPGGLRTVVRLTSVGPLRRALLAASDRSAPGMWTGIVCRKRYIDERVSDPVTEFDAIVILGSGLDTRPYRIARYSDLPVYEVDQQVNIDRKTATVQRVLGAVPASVRLVTVDFERDDVMTALADNGFRDTGRTLFIWEGVTQYLTPAAPVRLAVAVPAFPPAPAGVEVGFRPGTGRGGADRVRVAAAGAGRPELLPRHLHPAHRARVVRVAHRMVRRGRARA